MKGTMARQVTSRTMLSSLPIIGPGPPQEQNAGDAGGEDDHRFAQGVIASVIGKHRRHYIGRPGVLVRAHQVVRRDMPVGRGLWIPVGREVALSIQQQRPEKAQHSDGKPPQSSDLRFKNDMAVIKKTLLTPAPTAASVKATSTAPISANSRALPKL